MHRVQNEGLDGRRNHDALWGASREGRIEWNLDFGSCLYLGERDLQIGTRENHTGDFGFPRGHYQGITAAVNSGLADMITKRLGQ